MSNNDSETVWQKCGPYFWPRKTIDGHFTHPYGQTWRRRRPDGKWEYRQDFDWDKYDTESIM